ncbi:hypothetical protein RSOL_072700, partial [Rhizoctonia solani AG-3 Rhs1AP]
MSRPSAPGVSVDISGAAKLAARRIRRLGKAVPIDFSTEADNELVAWYRGRSDRLVRALQLRQEREGPYFHQFVVFELKDGGGFFRIDRRLRPDEDTPLNSLKDEGIPAYDTIEPVVAWDDPLFPASDCLISIEFKVDVYLALILKVCRAIQEHPLAKVYTLQRYNCYFFAQTIMLWATCGAADWADTWNWPQIPIPHPIHHPSDLVLAGETRLLWDNPMPRKLESFGIYFSNQDQWEELIDKYNSLDDYHERIENAYLDLFEQSMVIKIVYGTAVQQNTPQETTPDSNLEDIPQYRRPRRTIFRWRKAKQEQEQRMRPASIIGMQKYLVYLIRAHSIRVEQYKWATKAIATDVAEDIRGAMDEVWGKLIE